MNADMKGQDLTISAMRSEALEDRADAEALKKAVVQARHKGETPIPLSEAWKRLGLERHER